MDATASAVFQQIISELVSFNKESFFNGSFPEWITAIAAVVTLMGVAIAYIDYREKTRPYIDVAIQTQLDQGRWSFLTKISNKGQYPVYSKITNAMLIIGDEKYPTIIDKEWVLFPNESEDVLVPVGNINEIGRKKIREAKYTKNVVELHIDVSSKKTQTKRIYL